MTDDVILRMIEESCAILKVMEFHENCRPLQPTYKFIIAAARENHPQDSFIRTLASIDDIGEDPNVMRVLFTQLRIALEAIRAEQAETPDESVAMSRQLGAPLVASPLPSCLPACETHQE
jgi:hypothetical protein